MLKIIVAPRTLDVYASLEDDPEIWAREKNSNEAVGMLIRGNPERFGIKVEDRTIATK